MSVDRCPSCAAAVPGGAPWCTLCWAPLRTPEPVPAPVAVPAAAPVAIDPEPVAVVPTQPTDSPLPVEPTVFAATTALRWPCVNCNISVPMEDDECPDCGRRFLQEVMDAKAALIDRLPDLTEKKGFKAAVVVGGSLGLTVVLVVLLAIIGLFF